MSTEEEQKLEENLEFPVSSDAGKVNLELVVPKERVFNYISGFDNKSFHLKGELRKRVYEICQTLSPEDLTQGRVYRIAHLVYDIMHTQHEILGIEEEIGEYQVTLNHKAEDLTADKAMLETIVGTQPQIEGEVEEEVVEKKKMSLVKRILAGAAISIVLGAGYLAYANRGKIMSTFMSEPASINVEKIVNEGYNPYTEAIALAEEQKKSARALLVGADGANDDIDLMRKLLGGLILDRILSNMKKGELSEEELVRLANDGIGYFEPKREIPVEETRTYRNFLTRNEGNENMLRVMRRGVDELKVDGIPNRLAVINALEYTVSQGTNAFIGFFNPYTLGFTKDTKEFMIGGENLFSTEINNIIKLVGNSTGLFVWGVGDDSGQYFTGIKGENMVEINSGEMNPSGNEFIYSVEKMVDLYFQNPNKTIIDILNGIYSKHVVGSFFDKDGKQYSTLNTAMQYDPLNWKQNIFFEDGTNSRKLFSSGAKVTSEERIYVEDKKQIIAPIINPETELPYRRNFADRTWDDFFAGK